MLDERPLYLTRVVNREFRVAPVGRYATRRLSFLGRLQPVTAAPRPYAGQVTQFADDMLQERGLSPRTIEIRCRTVCEFLARLGADGLRHETLTIAHVDDVLARQVREGDRLALATQLELATAPTGAVVVATDPPFLHIAPPGIPIRFIDS